VFVVVVGGAEVMANWQSSEGGKVQKRSKKGIEKPRRRSAKGRRKNCKNRFTNDLSGLKKSRGVRRKRGGGGGGGVKGTPQ